jgi:ABC-2 type transport system permease protein
MNWRTILTLMRKDLSILRGNTAVWAPILIVPVILLVLLPAAALLLPNVIKLPGSFIDQIAGLVRNMPPALREQLSGLNEQQTWVVVASVYFFAPFFLMVPVLVSEVIGADSFAGEKERKTLEALLYTPATDMELFLGKVLTAMVPALLVSWGAFLVYTLVVNLAGLPIMGRLFFPTTMWLVLIFWVVPAAAALGLAMMVVISSRVSTFQAANQIGGVVVLPIVVLLYAQIAGVLYFSLPVVFLVGLVLWIAAAVLIAIGVRTLGRSEQIALL